ncbi:hypothetical protein SDC9_139017 [bioreactor metagenome]|uniref:Uncharacterized protein n=1 Tax=bioreactor metagenome TaxID=1076179 RepID=A0A645DTG8_9ZZZZ
MQRKCPNEIHEEALSAAETPDDDSEGCPAVLDPFQVGKKRGDFLLSANLDEMQPQLGNEASLEGLQNGVTFAAFDGIAHDFSGV